MSWQTLMQRPWFRKRPPIPFVQCSAQHDPVEHSPEGGWPFCLLMIELPASGRDALSSYEVSFPSVGPGPPSSFFFSWLRFHGRNSWMSPGNLPPAAAQHSKYHVSHFRELSPHSANVAKIENAAAANRPLQREPEP